MAWTAVVSIEGGRVAKYLDGLSQAEAEAHVATYGGEAVDASALNGPVLHWLKDGGVWGVRGPTDAERAALIRLPRTTMEPVLTAALQAGGASVTLVTIGSYVDSALAASNDLTDDEKEIGRWLFKSASTFHRGDPEVVIADPETTAAQLLEKCAAVFGFGAGGLGESPTWAERVAAAGPALDTLFLQAEALS